MKHVVFDSYALIALFRKEDGFEFVRDVLIKLSEGELTGSISVISVGEIYYMVSRKSNVKKAELAISSLLQFPIEIIDAGFELSLEAAKLKSRYKLSYADAFAAAISISQKATLITGDQGFNNLKAEKGFHVHFI